MRLRGPSFAQAGFLKQQAKIAGPIASGKQSSTPRPYESASPRLDRVAAGNTLWAGKGSYDRRAEATCKKVRKKRKKR